MCIANTLGTILEKTTPKFARPFDIGHRVTKKVEDKLGYGPVAPPGTVMPRRVLIDPAVAFQKANMASGRSVRS
jgi:hypothetical protein